MDTKNVVYLFYNGCSVCILCDAQKRVFAAVFLCIYKVCSVCILCVAQRGEFVCLQQYLADFCVHITYVVYTLYTTYLCVAHRGEFAAVFLCIYKVCSVCILCVAPKGARVEWVCLWDLASFCVGHANS